MVTWTSESLTDLPQDAQGTVAESGTSTLCGSYGFCLVNSWNLVGSDPQQQLGEQILCQRVGKIPHKCNFTKPVGKCFWLLIYFSSPWLYLSQLWYEILCLLQLNRSSDRVWVGRESCPQHIEPAYFRNSPLGSYWVANIFHIHKVLVFWKTVLLCYSEIYLLKIMVLLCFSGSVFG